MRIIPKLIIICVAAIGVSGCVNSDLERAAVGAGVGAAGAAVLGTSVAAGAVVGGAAGALCDDVNLC